MATSKDAPYFSINNSVVASTQMRMKQGYNAFTSYRTEAVGMLGAMDLYDKLQEYTKLKCGHRAKIGMKLLCDNEALVKTINRLRARPLTPNFFYTPDADIIREILVLISFISNQGETVEVKHIKGHQDRQNRNLSTDALLNVEADTLATSSLRLRREETLDLPNNQATLLIDGRIVSSNHTAILRETFQLVTLREHYNRINSWDEDTFDKVWWDPCGVALSCLRPGEQSTIQKFLQNRLPCNRREHLYYGYISEFCAVCGEI
jgi:hypothetical protein